MSPDDTIETTTIVDEPNDTIVCLAHSHHQREGSAYPLGLVCQMPKGHASAHRAKGQDGHWYAWGAQDDGVSLFQESSGDGVVRPLFARNDMGTAHMGATDQAKPYEHFARTRVKSALADELRKRFDEHARNEGIDETEIELAAATLALLAAARRVEVADSELGDTRHGLMARDRRIRDLIDMAKRFGRAETARANELAKRGRT